MTYEQQNLTWQCLPAESKKEVKQAFSMPTTNEYEQGYDNALVSLFGHHNLTSDAEGEEMLTVSRKKVQELYNRYFGNPLEPVSRIRLRKDFQDLFGSKCLPDEVGNEDNFASKEPKPAEPTNEGTRQEQCVPKNAESGTRLFDTILKDGFREHNRLHIAAMAMQGLLSNTTRFSSYEISDLVRISLNCADALITEVKKGGLQ